MLWSSGADQLTLWPEVSPASPSVSPGRGKATPTTAGCGPKCCGSCEKCDPVGSWLRTCLASALSERTRCSLIWKRKATPVGRSWWVLDMLVPPTEGTESGSSPDWRTPTAEEAGPRIETLQTKDGELRLGERLYRSGGPHQSVTLGLQAGIAERLWPTATAGDAKAAGSRAGTPRASEDAAAHPGTSLTDAANGLWARPQARDWRQDGECPSQHRRKSPNIHAQVIRLSCEAGPPDPESSSTPGKPRDSWPTARGQDSYERRNWKTVVKVNEQGGDLTLPSKVLYQQQSRGSLNPAWVAQLMGLPDGWLDGCDVPSSKPLETVSSPRSSRKSAAPSSRRKLP